MGRMGQRTYAAATHITFERCYLLRSAGIEPNLGMKLDDIVYRTTENNLEELNVEAWHDGKKVGYALCERHREQLKICDLWIEQRLRRNGIGTGLLRHLLQTADAAGVREIWGEVTLEDVGRWHGLLQWYERHNFVAQEPDDACIPTAAKKIIRRR